MQFSLLENLDTVTKNAISFPLFFGEGACTAWHAGS